MSKYYFDRELDPSGPLRLSCAHGVELRSMTGILIISANEDYSDDSYVLRYELELMTRTLGERLIKRGFTYRDFFAAANYVKKVMWLTLDAISEEADDPDDYVIGGVTVNQNMRGWAIYSDPFYVLEVADDDLMDQEKYSETRKLDWPEIGAIAGLWAIDEAAFHIENNQPYKAASWALRAAKHIEWMTYDETSHKSIHDVSRMGTFARHAPNRAARAKAVEIYRSRDWVSLAAAARNIAPQVAKTELAVLRWLREHRKNHTSAGTDPTDQGQ